MRFAFISYAILIFSLSDSLSAQQKDSLREIKNYINKEEFQDAKKLLDKEVKDNPYDPELRYLYGITLIQLVDHVSVFKKLSLAKKGRKELEKAIELKPNYVQARKELSDFYLYSPGIAGGNKKKALSIIESIKAFDLYRYHLYKGDYYMEEEQYDNARNIFIEAEKIFPDSLAPIAKAGLSYRRSGLYRESAQYFQRAIEMDSTYYLGYFHVGLAGLLGEFEIDKSIKYFHIYINYAEANNKRYLDHAYYRVGMLYELKKNIPEAKRNYEKSLEINAEYRRANEALKKLK